MTIVHFLAVEQRDSTLVVFVLRNIGCFSHDEFQDEWMDLLARLDDPSIHNVVLDFQRVAYFGSIVLEMTLQLARRLQSRGGRVVLCNLSNIGREIVQLARFDRLWPLAGNLDDACRLLAECS